MPQNGVFGVCLEEPCFSSKGPFLSRPRVALPTHTLIVTLACLPPPTPAEKSSPQSSLKNSQDYY